MKPQSAKAKGRVFQQWVRDKLYEYFPSLKEGDVRSTSMGASGEDLLLSPLARHFFPFSIECKNTESLNVWKAYDQCQANTKTEGAESLLFCKKNRRKPLAVVDAEYFIKLVAGSHGFFKET